ncbi:glycosyltransferase [Methylobacterium mesophilicum]
MNYISPKVTIAIPVYNGADYLREAVESALNQTYKNIEVIVLDDGSNDGGRTRDIAESFGPAIQYIHQENTGVSGALNHIIRMMTGDIFTWLSHDDVYFPHKTQAQVEYFKLIAMRDAIIFSDVHYIDGSGKKIDESRLEYSRYILSPKRALLDSAINGCTLFIPVHILREFGPFDLALRYTQDYDLWDRILTKYDFYHLPLPLIKYRLHSGQGTHRPEAVVEGDKLWVNIAQRRTESERALIAGSTQRYFEKLGSFLAKTPYKHAAVHVAAEAVEASQNTRVTVLLLVKDEVDASLFAAASVLRQTHQNFELLFINIAERNEGRLSLWASRDERIKILSFPKVDPMEALARGSLYATGDYVAFIGEGSIYNETKLEKQISHMQLSGVLLTWCASVSLEPDEGGHSESTSRISNSGPGEDLPQHKRLSTLMVHRNLVCAGELQRMLLGCSASMETVAVATASQSEIHEALVVCSV